jgi:hypothetical protein
MRRCGETSLDKSRGTPLQGGLRLRDLLFKASESAAARHQSHRSHWHPYRPLLCRVESVPPVRGEGHQSMRSACRRPPMAAARYVRVEGRGKKCSACHLLCLCCATPIYTTVVRPWPLDRVLDGFSKQCFCDQTNEEANKARSGPAGYS